MRRVFDQSASWCCSPLTVALEIVSKSEVKTERHDMHRIVALRMVAAVSHGRRLSPPVSLPIVRARFLAFFLHIPSRVLLLLNVLAPVVLLLETQHLPRLHVR